MAANHHLVGSASQHSAMINSLRAGLKASASSSVSGLSGISSHHLKQQHHYCTYKPAQYSSAQSFYGAQQSFIQAPPPPHYHHHAPTADLLGTGYQCQQQQQQQPPPQYPIYHIETSASVNPNQTTRLIWQNGPNGTSPDGFTMDGSYMPLSASSSTNHAPSRSTTTTTTTATSRTSNDNDSSAYQTIY